MFRELKEKSKRNISGNLLVWNISRILLFAATFVAVCMCEIHLSLVSVALIILVEAFALYFNLLFTKQDIKCARGGKLSFQDMYAKGNINIPKSIGTLLVYMFLVYLLAIVSFLVVGFIGFAGFLGTISTGDVSVIIVAILIGIAAFVAITIFNLNFAFLPHILVDETEDVYFFAALKRSMQLMKGRKLKLIGLYFSFFGWTILSLLTLGLAYIYVGPYMFVTVANFYLEAKEKN